MMNMTKRIAPTLAAAVLIACSACGASDDSAATGDDDVAAAPLEQESGYAVGRITMEDGSPVTGDVLDYTIIIQGVTEAAENASYSPIVENGTYRQKLAPGQYSFPRAMIKVRFGGTDFLLDLEPVGQSWNKDRDAAHGIVQDFVWKPTGQRETYGEAPDPNNATHWYGLNVGMRYQIWREDTNSAPAVLPEGTKLVFTFTPTSQSIDGRTLQPIVVERQWMPNEVRQNDDLNDLPPATYDLTGIAQLPDGSTQPILLQGKGDYPRFVTTGRITLENDAVIGGMWKQLFGWVTD